ncbi:MAG: SDR family oxidoreductase [Bacteroidota bacterium]|nr:SDR family oxidoreductase [Bacteroidota bacterium]
MNRVLITGVSGGIGKAVTEQLISSGISVIGLDLAFKDEIKSMAAKNQGLLVLQETNLMDIESLPGVINDIVSKRGPLSGFVHCAGFDKMAPIQLAKIEDIENLWKMHALVPMVIIATISKKKNHDDNTSIVLISSQSAHEGAMGHSAYAAAKGAIEGYLAPAAAELMEKGIRINEVCFAPVKTPMAAEWMNKLDENSMQKLLGSYPLGIGEVEDASNLICFLLSHKSRWINGQIITADGGHSVRKV